MLEGILQKEKNKEERHKVRTQDMTNQPADEPGEPDCPDYELKWSRQLGDPVQVGKELLDINLVNTRSMPYFLKVGDLAIAALQAKAGKYSYCLRITSHYFTNGHLFSDHVGSLLQGRRDPVSPPLLVMLPETG